MPKGSKTCPNCHKEVGPRSSECKFCQHKFVKKGTVSVKAFVNKTVERAVSAKTHEGSEALARVIRLENMLEAIKTAVVKYLGSPIDFGGVDKEIETIVNEVPESKIETVEPVKVVPVPVPVPTPKPEPAAAWDEPPWSFRTESIMA